MIKNKAECEYYIAVDSFDINFPEGDYTIDDLKEWYEVIPTEPKVIGYYGDNIDLMVKHFQNFSGSLVKTRMGNDMHSDKILHVQVLVIYTMNNHLQGFAVQEWVNGFGSEVKIEYYL